MTFSRILRAGAATAALSLAPALAFAATPSATMSGTMGSHACTCSMRYATPAASAPQAQQRAPAKAAQPSASAHDAFLRQVWTAP